MRYDSIIIGGGLSGLTAGITLASAGQKVAILAKGSSRLQYFSGSIDLLGYNQNEEEITEPLKAIAKLNDKHPYRKLSDIASLAVEAGQLLSRAGIRVNGDCEKNHYRLTPIGHLRPSWLTIDGFPAITTIKEWEGLNVNIFNIKGFLDFPADITAGNLKRHGINSRVTEITTPELSRRRFTPSEMRSTSIAAALSNKAAIASLAGQINSNSAGSDLLLLPALIGPENPNDIYNLRHLVNKPISLVATLPPSVVGNYLHTALRKHFINMGGTFILGSTVKSGEINGDTVVGIKAKNLPDQVITADNYILASGSLNSGGIVAGYDRVFEPIFDLDVNVDSPRDKWISASMYDPQPYMDFGVIANNNFNAIKNDKEIKNLHVIGSILAYNNAVKLGDEGGVSMLTALSAARHILSS